MKIAINMLNGAPEIFESIQGEGRNRGQKCVFIRLKGCNLHCSWCEKCRQEIWYSGGNH